jgi:probable blue pigment (indigoidine) exporter
MTNYLGSAFTLQTAGAPATWGTTYWITSELLPPDRPLLAAAGRALPAGVVLALATRRLPAAGWGVRLAALATLNVGLFFVLLFVGAERLPGGVAATAGALAPIVVLLLGWPLLRMRPTAAALGCGALGVVGVAALVLGPTATLDPLGLAAAAGATVSMGVATVLARRWGPPPMPLLAFTAWQLLLGGAMIAPVAILAEGTPPVPTARNLAGFAIIGLVGTALAFALWFRGVAALPASSVAFLGLLSPIVATVIGWAALGQSLTSVQLAGAVLVGASIVAGQRVAQPSRRRRAARRLTAAASDPSPAAGPVIRR